MLSKAGRVQTIVFGRERDVAGETGNVRACRVWTSHAGSGLEGAVVMMPSKYGSLTVDAIQQERSHSSRLARIKVEIGHNGRLQLVAMNADSSSSFVNSILHTHDRRLHHPRMLDCFGP